MWLGRKCKRKVDTPLDQLSTFWIRFDSFLRLHASLYYAFHKRSFRKGKEKHNTCYSDSLVVLLAWKSKWKSGSSRSELSKKHVSGVIFFGTYTAYSLRSNVANGANERPLCGLHIVGYSLISLYTAPRGFQEEYERRKYDGKTSGERGRPETCSWQQCRHHIGQHCSNGQ